MIFKRCHEKGCPEGKKDAPRCKHGWYFHGEHQGHIERGPLKQYAHLLLPGQVLPTTKTEALDLEKKIYTWLATGRPAPTPTQVPPTSHLSAHKTVDDVIRAYRADYADALRGKGHASALRRISREVGDQPCSVLFDRQALKTFLADVLEGDDDDTPHLANRNRHLDRWRHMTYWLVATDKLAGRVDLPFYDKLANPFGVRKLTEGDGRTRRLDPETQEEARIIAACERLAATDGGMMLGRYYCAVDAGLRRGEMQKLQKAAVLTNYQGQGLTLHVQWHISKTAKERFVAVSTDRLRRFVQERRFAQFPFGQADGSRLDDFRVDWDNVLIDAAINRGHYEKGVWVCDHDADLHWHDLRHECGSRLADANVPLHEIQRIMGHTKLDTTQKYLNASFVSMATNMRNAALRRGI